MSKLVITGAAGFLGRRLAEMLSAAPSAPSMVLWDTQPFPDPPGGQDSVTVLSGDLMDEDLVARAFEGGVDAVVHLAAVVSAQAEADFDLGMRVNVDATRMLLERARALGTCPTFVMTSSVAVFGGELPESVPDHWQPTPQSSYGAEKAICERLVSEYSRRGFVDGRVLRLPTVAVRPGRPNKAASSFVSSVIREPLNGEPAVCPVAPETPLWLMSPGRAVDALAHALRVPAKDLGDERVISLPGISVRTDDWIQALARLAGDEVAARVRWEYDPAIAAIVQSWPGAFEATRARGLGFQADADADEIIAAHMAEQANLNSGG